MTEGGEKRGRGRPTIYKKAMTPAERQRRSRMRRTLPPHRRFVEEAQGRLPALLWSVARIEEMARDERDGPTRERLIKHCDEIRLTHKKLNLALKRILRPPAWL